MTRLRQSKCACGRAAPAWEGYKFGRVKCVKQCSNLKPCLTHKEFQRRFSHG